MRRLARWTLHAVTVLSLLMCAATAALWVRGYWRPYRIVYPRHVATWEVTWTRGRLVFDNGPQVRRAKASDAAYARRLLTRRERVTLVRPWPPADLGDRWSHADLEAAAWLGTSRQIFDQWDSAVGADLAQLLKAPGRRRGPIPQPVRRARSVPAVCLPAVTVAWLVPAAWATYRRRRRFGRGLCGACGYDLTGNVSGVCPECGTAVAPAHLTQRLHI